MSGNEPHCYLVIVANSSLVTLMRSLKAMGEYQPRLWLEMVVLALKALYVNRSLREIGNCAKESKLSRPEGTVEVEVFSSQDVNRGGT